MCGVPRAVAATLLVGVPQLRDAGLAVARPVSAGVIRGVRVGAAVRLRTGEDVMLVRVVADTVDHPVLLGSRQLLAERISEACRLDRVAVQFGDVLRHTLAAGVVPGAVPDAVARVHRASALCAQIRVPRDAPATGSRGERLAMRIGAGDAPEIRAVA